MADNPYEGLAPFEATNAGGNTATFTPSGSSRINNPYSTLEPFETPTTTYTPVPKPSTMQKIGGLTSRVASDIFNFGKSTVQQTAKAAAVTGAGVVNLTDLALSKIPGYNPAPGTSKSNFNQVQAGLPKAVGSYIGKPTTGQYLSAGIQTAELGIPFGGLFKGASLLGRVAANAGLNTAIGGGTSAVTQKLTTGKVNLKQVGEAGLVQGALGSLGGIKDTTPLTDSTKLALVNNALKNVRATDLPDLPPGAQAIAGRAIETGIPPELHPLAEAANNYPDSASFVKAITDNNSALAKGVDAPNPDLVTAMKGVDTYMGNNPGASLPATDFYEKAVANKAEFAPNAKPIESALPEAETPETTQPAENVASKNVGTPKLEELAPGKQGTQDTPADTQPLLDHAYKFSTAKGFINNAKTTQILDKLSNPDLLAKNQLAAHADVLDRAGARSLEDLHAQSQLPRYTDVKEDLPETPEIRTSKLAQGVEAKAVQAKLTDGFEGLPEYAKVNVKDQTQAAIDLLKSDPDRAIRIAHGVEAPPEGLLPESVFTAVENGALKAKNVDLLQSLATNSSLTSEATGMGQRIRMLAERNPDSPVSAMKQISDARAKVASKKVGDIPKAISTTVKDIKSNIKPVSKFDWSNFVESIKC